MSDTLASLKQELKALGPVDYSTQTRQLREMIINKSCYCTYFLELADELN